MSQLLAYWGIVAVAVASSVGILPCALSDASLQHPCAEVDIRSVQYPCIDFYCGVYFHRGKDHLSHERIPRTGP